MGKTLDVCALQGMLARTSRIKITCNCVGIVVAKSPIIKKLFLVEVIGKQEDAFISTVLVLTSTSASVLYQWHSLVKISTVMMFCNMKNSILKYQDSSGMLHRRILLTSSAHSNVTELVDSMLHDFPSIYEINDISKEVEMFQLNKYSEEEFMGNGTGSILIPIVIGRIVEYLGHAIFLLHMDNGKRVMLSLMYYKLERKERCKLRVDETVRLYNVHVVPMPPLELQSSKYECNECLVCCCYSFMEFIGGNEMNDNQSIDISNSRLLQELELYPFPISMYMLGDFQMINILFSDIFDAQLLPNDSRRIQLGKPQLFEYQHVQQRVYDNSQSVSVKGAEFQCFLEYTRQLCLPITARSIHEEFIDHHTCIITKSVKLDSLISISPVNMLRRFPLIFSDEILQKIAGGFYPGLYFIIIFIFRDIND